MKTFDDYLREIHAKGYMGTDDNMPDAFNDWVGDLEGEQIIQLANEYGESLQERWGINEGQELKPNN